MVTTPDNYKNNHYFANDDVNIASGSSCDDTDLRPLFENMIDGQVDKELYDKLLSYYSSAGLLNVAAKICSIYKERATIELGSIVIEIVKVLLDDKRYDDCDLLVNIFASHRQDIGVFKKIGEIYRFYGLHDKALTVLRSAFEFCANDDTLCYEIGELYARMGDHRAAAEYFYKAVVINRSVLFYFSKMNDALLRLGETAKAIEYAQHVVSLGTDNQYIIFGLGKLLLEVGNYGEAEVLFRRAISIDDSVAMFYTHLAECYSRQKKLQKAINCLKDILPKFRDKPSVHYLLARLLIRIENFTDAETIIFNAIAIDETSSLYYRLAAECMRLQGKFDDACQLLRLAIKYDEHNPAHYFELSRCLRLAGDFLGADLLHDRAVMLSRS